MLGVSKAILLPKKPTAQRIQKRNILNSGKYIQVPSPVNDPIKSYAAGTPERAAIISKLKELKENPAEIPVIVNGKEYKTGKMHTITSPYNHKQIIGHYYEATTDQVKEAIQGSLIAKKEWAALPAEQRLSVFLRCAEILRTTYRPILNAATMLGQGKNMYQAEIDSACELIDFWRFNAYYAQKIYEDQPISDVGIWNRVEYRPLEGFIYAVTPFNFTAIAGNLCSAPAMMGNVCVWKPSSYAMLSSYYLMQIYKEAGLPDGVINMIPGDPQMITDIALSHPDFAGVHYTGGTPVFQGLWKKIGENIPKYKNYPRIVGETGGKDYIFAHPTSKVDALVTAIVRGAFEFQGQKCSAASRGFIPRSIWNEVRDKLVHQISQIKVGNTENPETLVGAVIHRESFNRCARYIEYAKNDPNHKILVGGTYDDSVGYFVDPTIIVTTDPVKSLVFNEEIFGPIFTIYVYEDEHIEDALTLCENHTYGLTGSIFGQDRVALNNMMKRLQYGAGNFYINDKPTGAVVGQQPFGGSRLSGTNDKAGSYLNLVRWVSPLSIKENFNPPTEVNYPYMTPQ